MSKADQMSSRNELTAERLRELLHYDPETGVFTRRVAIGRHGRWGVGSPAGSISKHHGYVEVGIEGRGYLAHRLAFLYMLGRWPEPEGEHRDLDKTNNRWSNLREATDWQNKGNRASRADNILGLKNVYWSERDRKWIADVRAKGKRWWGYFDTPGQAHNAACEVSKKYFGEYARDDAGGIYLGRFDCPAAAELASILNLLKAYSKPGEARHA